MATLRPFRQIHENDVVNLFALDVDAVKGAIVRLDTTNSGKNGWKSDDNLVTSSLGQSYANTVSDHWKVQAKVVKCAKDEGAFGMLLHDVRDLDENAESLLFNPRKAHEMQVSLKGHPVPILMKGVVMIGGINATGSGVPVSALTPAPNVKIFTGTDGHIITHATNVMADGYLGYCLGLADAAGNVLVKFEPHIV